jgi:CMD domain protein
MKGGGAHHPGRTAMTSDLIESLLGIAEDSPLGALRRRRPEALRHAEGAWRELVLPPDPGSLAPMERAAVALRVALGEGDAALAGHYRSLLAGQPGVIAAAEGDAAGGKAGAGDAPAGGPRLAALLRHADLVANRPAACGQAEIDALRALGLSPQEVVALTQLVAFVPYQVRLLAGLRALQGAAGAMPMPGVAERPYTLEEVGWTPRLPPVEEATATPAQKAALEACPPAQRGSIYFRTLALDPGSLGERGALFTTVMYAPRGLPRAERELATAIVSMVNGCVYCCAVHARRFVELTKQEAVMRALFEQGLGAEVDPRRRAIIDVAAVLTATPAAVSLAPARAAGLEDLELLDLIHCVAMFANANRLMQSLGDSILPGG